MNTDGLQGMITAFAKLGEAYKSVGKACSDAVLVLHYALSGEDKEKMQGLREKLQVSEKRRLRNKGLHPTKDRTHNLINYMDVLDDDEIQVIVKLVREKGGKKGFHEGLVPFLNRNELLNLIFEINYKRNPTGVYRAKQQPNIRGFNATTIIRDEFTKYKKQSFKLRRTY